MKYNQKSAGGMQKSYQAEHSSNDAFAKKRGQALAKEAGKLPKLGENQLRTDAYMCNNGKHAEAFTHKLVQGLDKSAYPVK